jgi:3-hydroxyacyl-CoA dehydrogenase
MSPIKIERTGSVAVLRLNSGPVNALSKAVRVALYDALNAANADPEVVGVAITGNGRVFSAGADITEFREASGVAMFAGRDPAEITAFIDAMNKPVVAAIDGMALGGGLELALGCHARVAATGALLGLPEITIGLLPGAGGTQRLPRLVGPVAAGEMILSGQPVAAAKALETKLIDQLIEGDLVAGAVAHVHSLVESGNALRRARDIDLRAMTVAPDSYDRMRNSFLKKAALAFAAEHIISCLEATAAMGFDEGMRCEREHFLACHASDAAAGLQHGFFAKREATKIPDMPAHTALRPIKQVAVLGAGTMGRGIAMAFANAGFPVTMVEADTRLAGAALQAVQCEYRRLADTGRLKSEEAVTRSARISASAEDEALRTSDLVIEAVFENLDIKLEVCRRLGTLCKPGAIIASNTSTLDIDVLAAATGRANDFLGVHFFSPAQVMRLVEVIRGKDTLSDALATVMALVRRLNKDAVVSGVCYGFIGNRMLEPYLRETEALLLEGCTPQQIDRALEAFGMAMGPCRMMDLAGVDVVAKVVIERAKQGALPSDPLYRIVCREFERVGRYGQKTGAGFYRYQGQKATEDNDAIAAIQALAARHGVLRAGEVPDEDIVKRCLLPLINEGFLILEEGIAYRESDIDVVWLSGYGFPAQRGGPMFYARQMGLSWVHDQLLDLGRSRGNAQGYWTPAALLRDKSIRSEKDAAAGVVGG